MEYINPALLSEGDWGPLSFVKGGQHAHRPFRLHEGKADHGADRGARRRGGRRENRLPRRGRLLRLADTALALEGFEGRLGEGMVSRVIGPRPPEARPGRADEGALCPGPHGPCAACRDGRGEVLSGTTEGDVELARQEGPGLQRRRRGDHPGRPVRLEARRPWRHRGATRSGTARVTFAPLVIERGRDEARRDGEARERRQADVQVKGVVDGRADRAPSSAAGTACRASWASTARWLSRAAHSGRRASVHDGPLLRDTPADEERSAGWRARPSCRSTDGRAATSWWTASLTRSALSRPPLARRIGKGRISGMHLVLDVPGVERAVAALFF